MFVIDAHTEVTSHVWSTRYFVAWAQNFCHVTHKELCKAQQTSAFLPKPFRTTHLFTTSWDDQAWFSPFVTGLICANMSSMLTLTCLQPKRKSSVVEPLDGQSEGLLGDGTRANQLLAGTYLQTQDILTLSLLQLHWKWNMKWQHHERSYYRCNTRSGQMSILGPTKAKLQGVLKTRTQILWFCVCWGSGSPSTNLWARSWRIPSTAQLATPIRLRTWLYANPPQVHS